MSLPIVDCRGLSSREAGLGILRKYNEATQGAEFRVLIDSLDAGLRMWLIEAGARHLQLS